MTSGKMQRIQIYPLVVLIVGITGAGKSTTLSVRQSTGLSIRNPVSYSALYDYNITGLYDLIIDNIPSERRPVERRFGWINR